MKFGQVGAWPADVAQPVGDTLLAGRGQLVHLAVRPFRQPRRRLRGHQARLLQPGQRDVDLTVVHPVAERAERLPQPRAQLIAVGRLLGQHRQHYFLLHGSSP